jgi:excinuclease UvrABC nuclease subunit
LVERLGVAFFRSIPREAGVYQMFDEAGQLIYVGKAGDLRARLNSYRRTHNQSRKTIRLIHSARAIRWELCGSDAEARLRENQLIRTHRPRFNRAGTWPRGDFVLLEAQPAILQIRLVQDPIPGCFGAFRGTVRGALRILGQLLWMRTQGTTDPTRLPYSLSATEMPRNLRVEGAGVEEWMEPVAAYFGGESGHLIERLTIPPEDLLHSFERTFHETGTTLLTEFYQRGPKRNRILRERFPEARSWIEPVELDDLPIRMEAMGMS